MGPGTTHQEFLILKQTGLRTGSEEKCIDPLFLILCRGRQALLEIAIALNVLHNNQVSHLDLKSANVLLRENGEVVVADVGLSKLMKQDSTNVSLPGTFAYSSPEQLQGRAGLKSDIWSFGTVLHEVSTSHLILWGRMPCTYFAKSCEGPSNLWMLFVHPVCTAQGCLDKLFCWGNIDNTPAQKTNAKTYASATSSTSST